MDYAASDSDPEWVAESRGRYKAERVRTSRKKHAPVRRDRKCALCGTNSTPLWRRAYKLFLCNACGLRRAKEQLNKSPCLLKAKFVFNIQQTFCDPTEYAFNALVEMAKTVTENPVIMDETTEEAAEEQYESDCSL